MSSKLSREIIEKLSREHTNLFDQSEGLEVTEVGDGNVNYIYLVEGKENSVIVKFADSFIRNSDTRQLSTKRNEIEYDILKEQYELSNGQAPKVYYYSPEYNCIIMENLSDYAVLREGMVQKNIYPHLGTDIGKFLYDTLVKTTDLVMDVEKKKEMQSKLVNVDMCEISERLVFTEPYLNNQGLNNFQEENKEFVARELYQDKLLHLEIAKLKNQFMNKSESMIHGDLHGGSIFINEQDIKVFDPEFAFYGPMGYDIGNVVGNLIISYVTAVFTQDKENYTNWLNNSIEETMTSFINTYNTNFLKDVKTPMFNTEEFKESYLTSIYSDTLGYAATEMIRRTVGVAKVWDLERNKTHDQMAKIERVIIRIGKVFINKRAELAKDRSFMSIVEQEIIREKGDL